MVKKYPLLFFLLLSLTLFSQNSSFYEKSDTLNIKRRNAIIISEGIVLSGALISLNELWYKNYPQRNFHLKNDYNQWKQMDKVGHFMTSYYGGKLGMDALNWAGVSKKKSIDLWSRYRFCIPKRSRNFRWFFRRMGCFY